MISFTQLRMRCVPRTFYSLSRNYLRPRSFVRSSSLSAIHRGLRRSEKARPQGSRSPGGFGGRPDAVANPSTSSSRKPRGSAREDPTFRIRKGKKDITFKSPPGPKTRSARFNDPNDSFGKKSHVFQLKAGKLGPPLKERIVKDASPTDSSQGREDPFAKVRDFSETRRSASGPKSSFRGRGARSDGASPPWQSDRRSSPHQSDRASPPWQSDRRSSPHQSDRASPPWQSDRRSSPHQSDRASPPWQSDRRSPSRQSDKHPRPYQSDRRFPPSRSDGRFSRRDAGSDRKSPASRSSNVFPRRDVGSDRDAAPRRWDSQSPRADESSEMGPYKTVEAPVSVPYTTAASQFLYGKFVVQAALAAARRKLYKLYIYAGQNRMKVSQDLVLEKMAQRKGVETKTVDEGGMRMMDKMSAGRPHNGYILEASPLPQMPLTGLGSISEDTSKPGFHVTPDHQSTEDAQINGTSTFVPTAAGVHKPLVLVLDQVLDPGNLGAILRTGSFLGVTAIAITKRNSASLTAVALKASAGASEYIPIFSIDSAAGFLVESRKAGWRVFAASPMTPNARRRNHVDVSEIETTDPLASDPCILLIGSEGEGLSKALRNKSDCEVSIPNYSGSSAVDSLNVSVATGLLCASFLKHRTNSDFSKVRKDDGPALW